MGENRKNIVLVATLDTKSDEAAYLKELIEKRGHRACVIDAGILGKPAFTPEISNEEVAQAAGSSIREIQNLKTEGEAIACMVRGVSAILNNLYLEEKMDGIIAFGGTMGTSLGLGTMRPLPLDIPKLMLSSIAFTSMVHPESVSIDQTMMQTVSDLWGLNYITKMVLQRAAGAICGMVEEQEKWGIKKKSVVAITTLGVHYYADICKGLLANEGYEPVVFHAMGTNACEKLIRQGYIHALLDLTIYELVNQVCGGAVGGGEEKITAATETGIPQVIAPGGLDFFTWAGNRSTLPPHLQDRKTHMHNPLVCLVQSTAEEKKEIARLLAERLNQAKEAAVVLVPLHGFSSMDPAGAPFHVPDAAKTFAENIKKDLKNKLVKVIEIDAHINDAAFAEKAASLLLEII